MREYCGINLQTRDFYVGSTANIKRRLKAHEEKDRVGGSEVFWLIGEEHEDDDRTEEQFYLDFYFRFPGCLNLSSTSKLGNCHNRDFSETHRSRLSKSLQGNTNGSANKGQKRSQKKRQFGVKPKDPEAVKKKLSEIKILHHQQNPKAKSDAKKAGLIGHISRWSQGLDGVYPATLEYRTALSSDFLDYLCEYGDWKLFLKLCSSA